MNAIEVSSLNFKYKSWIGKKNPLVFEDLSLTLKKGEHLLILSMPEGGKTTLSRIINALIPKFIEGTISGKILVEEKDILKEEPYNLVEDICYVSQNPLEMFITTTVENEIAFPLESLSLSEEEIKRKVSNALNDWGLSRYSKANPFELSGGERKRLLLAISFAINPQILILDESFDDLDKFWRDQLTQRIINSKNSIIVLSARYLPQFVNKFDKIELLESGVLKVINESEAQRLFTHQNISFYLKESRLLKSFNYRQSNSFMGKNTIEVKSLKEKRVRKSVENEKPFYLDCGDFHVEDGEIVRLTGANGSGKSTLSRILCGLDSYKEGSIEFNGEKALNTTLQANVGYLFQNPDFQIFLPTVYEELAWGLINSGLYSNKEIKEKVEECASIFSLTLTDTPTTMSFALRKRLQAAVYYLLDRPFLILDELDGAMSYDDAYFIIDELSKKGTSLIIITHDDEFAKEIADKTYHLVSGKVEALNEF